MRLVCPACGASASIEAWANDADMRRALKIVAKLPEGLGALAVDYLALFRPPAGRGLPWRRAAKLLEELLTLIAPGHIQWERMAARPCPPSIWAEAIRQILSRPPERLPLKSHGYLRAVAYDLADKADKDRERRHHEAERSGHAVDRTGRTGQPERITIEEMRAIRKRNLGTKG